MCVIIRASNEGCHIVIIVTPCSVSVVDVALSSGYTIGNFLSAIVYESWGFSGAFGLTIAVNAVNFGFIFLCLPESRLENTRMWSED